MVHMYPLMDTFEKARSCEEIVRATSRLIEQKLRTEPPPMVELAGMKIESVADIESWIDRVNAAIENTPLIGYDEEERAHRLLSYLLIASIRARQLQ